ncbi:MAG: alginate lyase family protein [Magnetovibrio sp.]|nr:alginate lyase family protein [Magnetovibrio sp.]
MKVIITFAVLTMCLSFPVQARQDTASASAVVTRPGEVFFNALERRQSLASMIQGTPKKYCRIERVCAYDPVQIIDSQNRSTGQTAALQGLSYWAGVTQYLRTGSTRQLEHARSVLNAWVDADALAQTHGHMPLARHLMKRSLFPTLTAYSVMRQVLPMPKDERERIERWLERGIKLIDLDNHDGRTLSDANNSRYSRDAVNMAWGVVNDDDEAFHKGIVRFRAALSDMRIDGSLPWETIRGPRVVSYQNLAISILIPMAEMAQVQGYNLYGENHQGQTIHDAIRFLINAEANASLVLAYSEQKQDKIRLGNHLHWTEIYLARFPDHANAQGLHDLRARYHFLTGRGNDFSGGNLSCAFANPDTNPVLTTRPPRKKVEAILKTSTVPRISCPKYLD